MIFPTIVVNINTAKDVVARAIAQGRFVNIMRPSIWGNPYSHIPGTMAKFRVVSRDEAIARFEHHLLSSADLLQQLPTLKGCVLGCCCQPRRCHGEVLARLANALP